LWLSWGKHFCAPILNCTKGPREENAAYMATWLDALNDDNRAIFAAAAHAQCAADNSTAI
jgi:antirestriction protein ArdC